ncbi:phage tail tape measure protein, TP901 family [Frankia torreyi]|uniref:Phage tail tape measure protein, TP901 family n=2 Tax=Frankia TaxID=1854 RepID=A0A0D8BAG7_9ACTN|nr:MULTISPECIES: phage tail tape measure protein [Frankia]KJE20357.1 phage tail tape measure protein, TP901 family [Frankia torreyi]
MAVVGTAEILIIPVVKGFANIGAQIGKQLDGVGLAAAGMSGQMAGAEKTAAGAASELGAAGLAAAGTGGKLASAGADAGKLEGGLGRTRLAATAARDGLKDAESSAAAFGTRLSTVGATASGAFGGMLGSVKGFALEAAKLGTLFGVAGVAGAIYEGSKRANEFDAAITRLNSQAGVSKEKLGTLSAGVLDLAGKVGADPDSLAESLFHVESNFSSLGITSTKALSLVETAAKGARVGNADLVDVTNALTSAVAANIPGVQNLDEAMGYLNATVGAGDMSMQNLADAMGTGAVAVVKGYGLSIKDVGAALAVLGDNNIRGAQAGTQLRMTVQSLAVPAKAGKAALEQLGLSQDTLAKDMQRGGLNAAITDLHNRLKAAGIGANEAGNVLTQAFGKKAGTGVNILVDQFDRLQSKYPELEKGAHEFGGAWDTTATTTKQKIADMKGAFDSFLIKVGQSTRGIQGSAADLGTRAFGAISKGIDSVGIANKARTSGDTSGESQNMRKLTGVITDVFRAGDAAKKIFVEIEPALKNIAKAAGEVVGAGIHVIADVLKEISDHGSLARDLVYGIAGAFVAYKAAVLAAAAAQKITAAAAWLLNAALDANPVMLIVLAIAGLVAGLILAYRHVGWFHDAVNAVGRALKDAALWVAHMSEKIWHGLVDAFHAVVDAAKKVGGAFSDAFHGAEHLAGSVGHAFAHAFDAVEDATKAVGRWFQRMWDDSVRIVKGMARAVGDAFHDVYDAISRVVSDVLDFVGRHWRLLLVLLTGPFGLIVVIIVNNKDRIVAAFKDMWEAVSGFVSRLWHDVSDFFSRMWHDVTDIASRVWHDVSDFFSRIWSDVSGFASRIWHDVAGFFSRLWSDVSGFASRLWHDVAGFFTSLWHDVTGIATRLWHDVAGFFTNLWHDVAGFASNLWHDVAGFFTNLWHDVTGIAGRIWHEVSSPFTSLWHEMTTTASNLWKDVTGWFDRIKNDITNSVKTATGWIKGAWDGLKEIFKAPINFLINPVYNSGIRKVWNAFAGIVHEQPLDEVHGFAAGGPITGGRPGRDSVLAMLMPGEHVWTAAEVAAAGGQQAMFALRRLFGGGTQARGIGMKDGGDTSILGTIGNAILHPIDTLESLGSGTLDVLGTAVHWVRGALADAASAAFIPIRAAVNATLGTGEDWKGAAGRLAERPMDAIVNLLRGQDGKDKAAAATAPVAAAPTGDIQAYAMQLLTQHGWANQWNAFNALEMGEAGWNPAALNRSSGAYGLAQALPASKYDSYGNRNDYHVQLRWMLDYIGQRYGSPANAYSTWLSRDPHWYDQGGPLKPGLTLAANGTGRDEWVVPKSAVSVASRSGGYTFAPGAIVQNIDARGASNPAEFERIVHRANADLVATLDQMLQQGVGAV